MTFLYEDPRREERSAKLRDAGYAVTDLGWNSEKEVNTLEIALDGVKGFGIWTNYDTWRLVTSNKTVLTEEFFDIPNILT